MVAPESRGVPGAPCLLMRLPGNGQRSCPSVGHVFWLPFASGPTAIPVRVRRISKLDSAAGCVPRYILVTGRGAMSEPPGPIAAV